MASCCRIAMPLDSVDACERCRIVQLRVIEGEGGVYGAGIRATRGLTVQVTDEAGKPVEGAAVSFRLPEMRVRPAYSRADCERKWLRRADGRATRYGHAVEQDGRPVEIRITAVKDQARAGS